MKSLVFLVVAILWPSFGFSCSWSCENYGVHLLADGELFRKYDGGSSASSPGRCDGPDSSVGGGGGGSLLNWYGVFHKEWAEIIDNMIHLTIEVEYQGRNHKQKYTFIKSETVIFQIAPEFLDPDPTRQGYYVKCTSDFEGEQ